MSRDDRRIHEVLLGSCIHRRYRCESTSGRDWVEITVICENCDRRLARERFTPNDSYNYDELPLEEARKRARTDFENLDWPKPGAVFETEELFQFHWCIDVTSRELVRQLEKNGWRVQVIKSGNRFRGTLFRGDRTIQGDPSDTNEAAIYSAALIAAKALDPTWRP